MVTKAVMNRVEWIDIAKGMGIYLMVFGHTTIPEALSNYIWMFHMPLFFILSGVLYNGQLMSFGKFLGKRLHSLVIPYFFFFLIVLLFNHLTDRPITKSLFTIGDKVYTLWFLQVMFWTQIAYFMLSKIEKDGVRFLVIFLLSLVGYYLYQNAIFLPYRLEVTAMALIYMGTAHVFRNKICKLDFKVWISILLVMLSMIYSLFIPRLDMAINCYGSYIPNIIGAWLGTIAIISISKNIGDSYLRIIKVVCTWGVKTALL